MITFGADPEVFVHDVGKDRIIPSCGLFGGEKGNPRFGGKFGGYLEDNVTLEINPNVFASLEGVKSNVHGVIKDLRLLHKNKYSFVFDSAILFKDEDLQHANAKAFGCDPDWDAYINKKRERIDPAQVGNWRFAGGHIHIGADPWPDKYPKYIFIKLLELFAYLPFVTSDKQPERRPWYGQAGLFRSKSYGVEYRTPSNFWLKKTDTASLFCYEVARAAETLLLPENKAYLIDIYNEVDWAEIKESIDSGKGQYNMPDKCHALWADCLDNLSIVRDQERRRPVGGPLLVYEDLIPEPADPIRMVDDIEVDEEP